MKLRYTTEWLTRLATAALLVWTGTQADPSASRGAVVYAKSCAACHGDNGDGKGPAAPYLDPLPRDFTAGAYKFRTTPSGELPTDQDLLRVVEVGVPGTWMPAWKGLITAQERADVVAYIKTLNDDFKNAPAKPIDIPKAPEATPRLVSEGKMVYMLMECWACHGGRGQANGKSAKTLKDDWGRPILPGNLTRYRYKGGTSPEDLYRTFTTGLNGTPMPAYALDGFLVAGDAKVDPAKYKEAYAPDEVMALRSWLRSQPSEAELGKMSQEQKNALGEYRKWALVHYIRSLIKQPNFLQVLFTENGELTR